jgi:hypothetical protein
MTRNRPGRLLPEGSRFGEAAWFMHAGDGLDGTIPSRGTAAIESVSGRQAERGPHPERSDVGDEGYGVTVPHAVCGR